MQTEDQDYTKSCEIETSGESLWLVFYTTRGHYKPAEEQIGTSRDFISSIQGADLG